MPTLAANPTGHTFCTHGTLHVEITVMVRNNVARSYYTILLTADPAALVMYIRSRKLAALRPEVSSPLDLVGQQLEALNVALNTLSLIDSKTAYIVVPSQDSVSHVRILHTGNKSGLSLTMITLRLARHGRLNVIFRRSDSMRAIVPLK